VFNLTSTPPPSAIANAVDELEICELKGGADTVTEKADRAKPGRTWPKGVILLSLL
jgi:hypothetical protein